MQSNRPIKCMLAIVIALVMFNVLLASKNPRDLLKHTHDMPRGANDARKETRYNCKYDDVTRPKGLPRRKFDGNCGP